MSVDNAKYIDAAVKRHYELNAEERRGHLGASAIGNRCVRQAWYGFRWAYHVRHTGRIHRLFNRGHEEEARLTRWLRMAGCEIQDYAERLCYHNANNADTGIDPWYTCEDWSTEYHGGEDVSHNPNHIALATELGQGPKQWHFKDHQGHFAGSSDGRIRGGFLEDQLGLGSEWGGVEYKTHGDKSFKLLLKKGVVSSKPVHYVQMQIYMHYFDLPWCLYVSTNKNDDAIYMEVVYRKPELALSYIDVAAKIINSDAMPVRITEDPSWFECRFCDYRDICHKGKPVQKNCRSCVFAKPVDNGQWRCSHWNATIPKEAIPSGCDNWTSIV